jgi:hypothetical protein
VEKVVTDQIENPTTGDIGINLGSIIRCQSATNIDTIGGSYQLTTGGGLHFFIYSTQFWPANKVYEYGIVGYPYAITYSDYAVLGNNYTKVKEFTLTGTDISTTPSIDIKDTVDFAQGVGAIRIVFNHSRDPIQRKVLLLKRKHIIL